MTGTRCQSLTVSPRAANQLCNLDPNDAASILDAARDRAITAAASLVEVTTSDTAYQCSWARTRMVRGCCWRSRYGRAAREGMASHRG